MDRFALRHDKAGVVTPDAAGECRLVSGSTTPLEFDPQQIEMLGAISQELPAPFPRVSRRGFYSYTDPKRGPDSLQIVSFLYDPSGGSDTKHMLVIWTGNGRIEHPAQTDQAPVPYLIGIQIGSYNPADHSYDLLYAETTKIEAQYFSLDIIANSHQPKPPSADPS